LLDHIIHAAFLPSPSPSLPGTRTGSEHLRSLSIHILEISDLNKTTDLLPAQVFHDASSALTGIQSALAKRSTAISKLNETSSRSHALVCLERPGHSSLTICDLAGTKNIKKAHASASAGATTGNGATEAETKFINTRLSNLTTLLTEITNKTQAGTKQQQQQQAYRLSQAAVPDKLTKILAERLEY
jgi:hypothetical protein